MSDQKKLLKRALEAIDSLTDELDSVRAGAREPIAVVGMSCRFPGNASSADEYWELLRTGASGITDIPDDRWDVDAFYHPDPDHPGTMTTRRGGFLEGIDGFDAPFFRISPREAATLDPQHRLLLECTWRALEDAGEAPDKLANSTTGVFVGITTSDYARLLRIGQEDSDVYSATGTALNGAAGRISFFLGLQGPCMAVDTACSSSLVAAHLACQALRARECERAIVGGVNAILAPEPFILFSKWGMLAPSGECRAFDEEATGFVRGEGCGVLVLKRLSDAQAAGDPIHAVILGSAVNQDGPGSGLSVPNGPAQVKAIEAALERADVTPGEVGFVEAHGTGTPIGDPIEIEALGEVYGREHGPDDPLFIGSVKTSIGHLESAAGVAGLMKLILSIREGELPPQRNYERPNPRIDWDRIPVRVVQQQRSWPAGDRRVGAVSGFGFTGTNVHMLVGNAPPRPATAATERDHHLLPISARTPEALRRVATDLADVLGVDDPPDIADVTRTLMTGRSRFASRAAVVGTDAATMSESLRALGEGHSSAGVTSASIESSRPDPIVFLYTGQGSQYPGMGLGLRAAYPAFRQAFDRSLGILRDVGGPDLMSILSGEDREAIHATAVTQPALFTIEYALTELYRSWGIRPAAVLGHSIGELVAACVAGVFSLEDALALTAARGRLMQELPAGGGMLAVATDADAALEVAEPFRDRVSLAARNGPRDVVLSGALEALGEIASAFEKRGTKTKQLTVSHAFHSPLMEPMQREWLTLLGGVDLRAPTIPVVSNLSGAFDQSAGSTAEYWSRHVREPVAFEPSMRSLAAEGYRTFLELGPRPVLLGMARRFLDLPNATWVPTLRGRGDEGAEALFGLAELFVTGQRPDWDAVLLGAGRRVPLPVYPFQRTRHWAAARPSPGGPATGGSTAAAAGHPLLGRLVRSPVDELQFECSLDPRATPLLGEHRVAGQTVFPAAGYIELARAAGRALERDGPVRLDNVVFENALILGSDAAAGPPDVRLVLTPTNPGAADFELFSRAAEAASNAPWQRHVSGRVAPTGAANEPEPEAAIRDRCTDAVDIDAYQARIAALGLDYGPAFRSLVEAHRSDGEAYGVVRLPEGTANTYGLHPGLLDAAFHLIGLAHTGDGDERFLLPVSVHAVEIYRDAGDEVRAHCVITEATPAAVRVDIFLRGPDGAPVASIAGLETRPITREQFAQAIRPEADAPLLTVGWRIWEPQVATESGAGNWKILAGGERELAAALARELTEAGATACVIDSDEQESAVDGMADADGAAGIIDLRPLGATDPTAELFDRPGADAEPHDPDASGPPAPAADGLTQAPLDATIELLRLMAERPPSAGTRLIVVTCRGQHIDAEDRVNPLASALWGMGATAAAEVPGVALTMVDVDHGTTSAAELVAAIMAGAGEGRIARRDDRWYVARLHPAPESRRPKHYELTVRARGDISSLEIVASEPLSAQAGQVEIEVLASGLNFRDVLNVLDMYPGDPGPLGNECCGRVLAVGPDVEDIAVGELVTCIAEGTFGSRVIAQREMVFRVPAELSIAQAAVFPIAYLTAHLALDRLGSIKRGDRVLIHSGAGGVGLAAVQLAQAAGAEVFATAGSEEKRDFLRRMGVREVWDSRELLRHETVREATDGRGVDLLLNALIGESIDEGIRSLAAGGRFLEIGLRELRSDAQVAAVRDDVEYVTILLGDWCKKHPDTVRALWDELLAQLRDGTLPPPRVHRFALESVEHAFRFMARARHIGRIAIVHESPSSPHIRSDAAYLVTGGLGALGLHAADWLASRGAREIVLMGRHPADDDAAARIKALEEDGANVRVVTADVTDATQLSRLSDASRPPIRGILHAAGVTDDATLARHDMDRMRRVLAPKADGALRLIEATQPNDLDHLVFFSSGSALLGSPGQAAYTAANGFLDGLAHRLHTEGRAAVSIGWGAWEGDGMAERVEGRMLEQWAASGIHKLRVEAGLDALTVAMRRGLPHVAVLPIRWEQLVGGMDRIPPFLGELVRPTGGPNAPDDGDDQTARSLAATLSELPEGNWRATIEQWLLREVAAVVGLRPDALAPDEEIASLGIDSLMALEIRNRIEAELGVVLPAGRLFEHPTVVAVAGDLLGMVEATDLTAASSPATELVEGEI